MSKVGLAGEWRTSTRMFLTLAVSTFIIFMHPATADDDCSGDVVYCDYDRSFKVSVPAGFKRLESPSAEVSAHFLFDGAPVRSCPMVSETYPRSDKWGSYDVGIGFWRRVFRLAHFEFENADLTEINDRRSPELADVGDPNAYNDHQMAMVHLQFKYKGQPFQAWQAIYWRKASQHEDPAKPIPSRFYFVNCTQRVKEGETVDDVTTTPPVSELFRSFTPLLCHNDKNGHIVKCSDAQSDKPAVLLKPKLYSKREGETELLSHDLAALAESAALAAAVGAR